MPDHKYEFCVSFDLYKNVSVCPWRFYLKYFHSNGVTDKYWKSPGTGRYDTDPGTGRVSFLPGTGPGRDGGNPGPLPAGTKFWYRTTDHNISSLYFKLPFNDVKKGNLPELFLKCLTRSRSAILYFRLLIVNHFIFSYPHKFERHLNVFGWIMDLYESMTRSFSRMLLQSREFARELIEVELIFEVKSVNVESLFSKLYMCFHFQTTTGHAKL